MKKKKFFYFGGMMIFIWVSLLHVVFTSCSSDDEDEIVEQPTILKPILSVVYTRVEYVNKIYTLEVVFGVSGVNENQNVKVKMKYGSSYDKLYYTVEAGRMYYSEDRYMCRLPNCRKGSTIALQGVLIVDGKEVDTNSRMVRIN